MQLAASGGGRRRRHTHGRAAGARAADPTSHTGAVKVDAAPRRCQPCRALLRPSCSPVDGDPSWRPAAVIGGCATVHRDRRDRRSSSASAAWGQHEAEFCREALTGECGTHRRFGTAMQASGSTISRAAALPAAGAVRPLARPAALPRCVDRHVCGRFTDWRAGTADVSGGAAPAAATPPLPNPPFLLAPLPSAGGLPSQARQWCTSRLLAPRSGLQVGALLQRHSWPLRWQRRHRRPAPDASTGLGSGGPSRLCATSPTRSLILLSFWTSPCEAAASSVCTCRRPKLCCFGRPPALVHRPAYPRHSVGCSHALSDAV